MILLDGKKVANELKENLKQEIDNLRKQDIVPKLAVISVGTNMAFETYIKNKENACNYVGINFERISLSESISQKELIAKIKQLNVSQDINGILLQSPIPSHLNINEAFQTIAIEKDVDGFNPANIGKLSLGIKGFIPCTAAGIIQLLDYYDIEISGKSVVVVGRSNTVGKPIMKCLLNKDATVTICHSKTNNLSKYTEEADILIVAVGHEKLITENMVKDGAVVVDVGINWSNTGKLVGDVSYDEVAQKCSYITPVPGGVGPMTVVMLLKNVVEAVKIQNIL